MKKIAVVPARGGSTRLKDKNIYPIAGKPLIRWITETLVESKCFDAVIISTDSDDIFSSVDDLPVERHERPESYATEKSTVLDAMIQLMETCPREIMSGSDVFSFFLPTHCPLISIDDIRNASNKIEDTDVNSVVGMTEMPETIQLACQMVNDSVLPVFDNLQCGMTNSKFIKKYFKPAGFYFAKWDWLIENRNFFKDGVKGVLIPKERSVDINDIHDILIAEQLFTEIKK